jgi:hypothetical protein
MNDTQYLKNLLCVKSITTIIVIIALCVLTFIYTDEMLDTFKSVITMIVTFYFSHQADKQKKEN